MRPEGLDDVVGQPALLGPDGALRAAIEGDRVPSMILYGPPGSGKTTLARVVASSTSAAFEELLGGLGHGRRRAGGDGAGARPPCGRNGHGALPGRDPPLQPGPAGRAAAGGGGRPADADRRHDPEPLVRGQRGPGLPHARLGARAPGRGARSASCSTGPWPTRDGLAGRVRLGEEARTAIARAPAATRAAPSTCSRPRRPAPPTARRSPSRPCSRRPAGGPWSTTESATPTTTRSRPSSRACAGATRTRRSTTWP